MCGISYNKDNIIYACLQCSGVFVIKFRQWKNVWLCSVVSTVDQLSAVKFVRGCIQKFRDSVDNKR
jgi:hypothetical protein